MKKSLISNNQSLYTHLLGSIKKHFPATYKSSVRSAFVLMLFVLAAGSAFSQKRDNLTNEEDLMARDAQEINLRMEVFVKIIDRRLLALNNADAAKSKVVQTDFNKWGELRTGTRAELFFDIEKTLSEAIGKIDDVAERDQKNPLFAQAVHILANACQRFMPEFKSLQMQAAAPKEKMLIENSIDDCQQIIEASSKVPKEVIKENKKKKN